jgi:hypothetical protein
MTAATRLQRARSFLDHTLFPEAPPPPRVTPRRALICAGLALLGVGMQLLRAHAEGPLKRLWAEDGSIWLPDALHRGFFDALTTPYNGYLQASSRLAGTAVSSLPIDWWAVAMSTTGAAIITSSAFLVWRASAAHIENPILRGCLAALIVVAPVASVETIANVTNSIWYIVFAAFWVILWRPATVGKAAAAAGFLFLAALSSAGSLILLPLLAARGVAARDRRDYLMAGAFSLGLILQVAFSWNDRNMWGEAPTQVPGPPSHWGWSLIPAYGQRIVGGATTGVRITGHLWTLLDAGFFVLVGIALAGWLATVAVRSSRRVQVLVAVAVLTSLALFLVTGYQRWTGLFGIPIGRGFYWTKDSFNDTNGRYLIVPTLIFLSGVFVWLDEASRDRGAKRFLALAVPAVIVIATAFSFSLSATQFRSHTPWPDALDKARRYCETQPPNTGVHVPLGGPGYMPLSCSELE